MCPDMIFEGGRITARIVAFFAFVRFFLAVNKGMRLQIAILTKRLVTLGTTVFDPIMGFLVTVKTTLTCKYLQTQVTSYLFWHLPTNSSSVGRSRLTE